ncbi:polymorphic toxin-type HINT domain-containing protein [Actinomadura sp. 3N508]|uniref:polymorphic toxin-type HINT domain-containing protein n=1 Tax=Actinomadura sp. 3N508 TaxID=3375153 RepID=UPI0037AF3B30
MATDPATGKTRAEPVLDTITSKGDKKLVQITINTDAQALPWAPGDTPERTSLVLDERKQPKSGMVIATDSHPFWVAGDINKWVKAADLKPGMWLRTSAGIYVQITATEHAEAHNQRVHNLAVANTHTYYALVNGIPVLVHNAPPSPWDYIDGPWPQRGQTALYALWDTHNFEFVKWGVWTNNTTGSYSRYTAKYFENQGLRMQVLKTSIRRKSPRKGTLLDKEGSGPREF